MKKGWVTDLDGTLLNNNKQIDPSSDCGHSRLRNHGYMLFICTGRNIGMIEEYSNHVQNQITIGCNGGVIYDHIKQELLYAKNFSSCQVQALIDFSNVNQLELNIYGLCDIYYIKCGIRTQSLINSNFPNVNLHLIEHATDIKEDVYKVVFYIKDLNALQLQAIRTKLKDFGQFSVCQSSNQLLDVNPLNVSKKTGIRFLKENLGFEKIIAIGDDENDLDMITEADFGIAMGNACNLLKSKANYITESNEKQGYLNAINKILRSENAKWNN